MAFPTDDFVHDAKGLESPSRQWATITPHNTNPLAFLPRAIACGATAGTVTLVDEVGNESTFYLNAGQILAVRPVIVKTGGTATPIIALR